MKPLEPPVQREGERAGEHEDVRERRRALRSVRQQRSVHAEHHGEHAQALDCLDGLSTLAPRVCRWAKAPAPTKSPRFFANVDY